MPKLIIAAAPLIALLGAAGCVQSKADPDTVQGPTIGNGTVQEYYAQGDFIVTAIGCARKDGSANVELLAWQEKARGKCMTAMHLCALPLAGALRRECS